MKISGQLCPQACGNPSSPRPSALRPSLDLLQVLGPKGDRQQLLDRPDDVRAVRLGHVDSPVGAELEKRQSQHEGGSVAEGWDLPGSESGSTSC